MADDDKISDAKFRFVYGPSFETCAVSGTFVRANSSKAFSVYFYVERAELEKTAHYRLINGEPAE